MNFNFIYEPTYYPQVMFACLVDARKGTPLANQTGDVIKAAVDLEIAQITDNVLFYKIEADDNVLAGYFAIMLNNMGGNPVKFKQVLRPAFQVFSIDISILISNFIQSNGWQPDFLT